MAAFSVADRSSLRTARSCPPSDRTQWFARRTDRSTPGEACSAEQRELQRELGAGDRLCLRHVGIRDIENRAEVVRNVLGRQAFLCETPGLNERQPGDTAHAGAEDLTVERA